MALIKGNSQSNNLRGTDSADVIYGYGGDDVIDGLAGPDKLFGGAGADTQYGGSGNDIINPGPGYALDRSFGGLGNDTLNWNPGATEITTFWDEDNEGPEFWANFDGGPGTDHLRVTNNMTHYSNETELTGTPSPTWIIVDADGSGNGLVALGGEDFNDEEGGLVTWFRNVETFSVTETASRPGVSLHFIHRGTAPVTVTGTSHRDEISGGGGKDVLRGALGTDELTGGPGGDRFDFNSAAECGKGTARDVITDFARGVDRIDLATIDADTDGTSGNQAFSWRGSSEFSGVDGQLRYFVSGDSCIVQGDTNGDRVAELELQVLNVSSLASTDFYL